MSARKVTVFYHGDCLDGFGAAWCAWRHFGTAADYQPLHHGEPWPEALVAGREVFILDFSAPRTRLQAIARQASRTVLLDHHATPHKEWLPELEPDAACGWRRFDDEASRLTLIFDMERSGAHLAWDWFFPGEPMPRLLAHVEDLDLWRFALPETRAFCRALRQQPFDFGQWDRLVDECGATDAEASPTYRQMLLEGGAVERFLATEVRRLAESAVRAVALRGEPVDPLQAMRHGLPLINDGERAWRRIDGLAVNASALFTSELGGALAARSGSVGLVWQVAADGRVKASLRGDGRVNVATIAEQYGGGGHPNAAGFVMALADFVREVLQGRAADAG